MKMNFSYIPIMLMTFLLGICYCQVDTSELTKIKNRKYCGGTLSSALSMVCRGNYNTLNKKAAIYEKKSYWDPSIESELRGGVDYPFTRKSRAVAIIGKYHRRRRRGVYNECCEKSCSYQELSSYCGHT